MTYGFNCPKCNKDYDIYMTFDEYDNFKEKDFPCPFCEKKGLKTKLKRIYESTKFIKIFLKGEGFTRKEA